MIAPMNKKPKAVKSNNPTKFSKYFVSDVKSKVNLFGEMNLQAVSMGHKKK